MKKKKNTTIQLICFYVRTHIKYKNRKLKKQVGFFIVSNLYIYIRNKTVVRLCLNL